MTADRNTRSIILEYWWRGSEIYSGKERAADPKYLLGYIFQAAKWLFSQMSHVQGNLGDFQPFLITAALQKRGCLVFKLCLTHSQSPQPEM